LATTVALLGLTGASAGSTAVFNSTYKRQVGVDASLTNGADVTVTEPPSSAVGQSEASTIAAVAGVRHVEPLQHRFAYVGTDLQDLYGIRPGSITQATKLEDAYFSGGSAHQLLGRLAARPDGVLVSAETVRDFQLQPGDLLRLRLRDNRTGALRTVPFHYAGVVKEFPTAPKDSFLVANAAYVAGQTGSDAVGAFLVSTGGSPPAAVANRVRAEVGIAAAVTDIQSSRREAGSSLTAVDLSGLTRVELGFALALAAAASGLLMALVLTERRRTFTIVAALGGRPRQVASFARTEAAFVTAAGILAGLGVAWGLAVILVKVLTGVFDPPPTHLAVPWVYLGVVGALAVAAAASAAEITVRWARRPVAEALRDT
jgi:putative ABC transport system permease protein